MRFCPTAGPENTRRQQRGLSPRPIDERLLAAHRHGLPECAGVALGWIVYSP
ncbi:MAG: hypothetical protein CM15mP103_00770 [Gammaproteobacteria bacterium]|nr:MAG: hypothetical protein CM15mP103_00770 [Gammaproteobacteria bacterium]